MTCNIGKRKLKSLERVGENYSKINMENLINFGFKEMTHNEMLNALGGNIFVDAWNGIKDFFSGLANGLSGN